MRMYPSTNTFNLESATGNYPSTSFDLSTAISLHPHTSFSPETDKEECSYSPPASICFNPEVVTEMHSSTSEQHNQVSYI